MGLLFDSSNEKKEKRQQGEGLIPTEDLEVGCVESWASVKGSGGWYEVSTHGRVRSMPRTVVRSDGTTQYFKSRILKPGRNRNGYLHVTIGKVKNIHRLVAKTFIPNPHNLPQVNHKDGNKENNCVWNLEWVNHQANMQHASKNGLASGGSMPGESNPNATLTREIILKIRSSKEPLSVQAKRYNVSKTLISLIKRRKAWKHIPEEV